jgi:hypothetical protein
VAESDEFFAYVGDDPLSAAIETRRNALKEGSDLCDFHINLHSPQITNAHRSNIPHHSSRIGFIQAPNRNLRTTIPLKRKWQRRPAAQRRPGGSSRSICRRARLSRAR